MAKTKTASEKKDTYFVPDFNVYVEASSAEEAAEIAKAQQEQTSETPTQED